MSISFGVFVPSILKTPPATVLSPTLIIHLFPSYTSFVAGPSLGAVFSSTSVLPSVTSETVSQVPRSLLRSDMASSPPAGDTTSSPMASISRPFAFFMRHLVLFRLPRSRLLGADKVAFGVAELDDPSHGGDFALGQGDRPAVGHDCRRGCIDVLDLNRALIAGHAHAGHDLVALLQGALDARVVPVAGGDEEESRGTPGAELPAEDLFVKSAGTRQVVRMNREE